MTATLSPDNTPDDFDRLLEERSRHFEAAWRAGSAPRLEDFLADVPDAVRADLLRTLLKLEIQEDLRSYLRGGVLAVGGGVVATVGLALTSVGVALSVATLVGNVMDVGRSAAQSLGFVLVGVVSLIGGTVVAVRAARRLAGANLAPERTVRELGHDREWLRPGRS